MGLEPGTVYQNKYTLQLEFYNNGVWNTVETQTGFHTATEQPTRKFYLSNKIQGQYRIRCYGSLRFSNG